MSDGETSEETVAARRFAAFISYAHADAVIAAKLQSRLERYRLPKHVAEISAGGGAALGQIFRDREDLAAAPSLSDAIRAAIAQSATLLVICSPDAKASRWVNEEIRLFQQLHPDRPILSALARGEPDEAFPPALTEGGVEPLAADLRSSGDGEQLGFLKIVAGIAGVPLDALIQRDAQRRLRRVTWITGGALTAMLIMGVMTTFAIQARNEAARQRASAEGLVEFMLTDLRTRLKGVGSLKTMDAVNRRALEFYSNQGDLNALPPDSLERRARLLHAMGEDYEKTGNLHEASIRFVEAHRITKTLLEREPTNVDRIFAHAQSEYWVGHPAELKGDWPVAMRQYQSYARAAEKLIDIDPDNPDFMMEMAWGQLNVGIIELKSKAAPNYGRVRFAKAIEWMETALGRRDNDLEILGELANAWGWLADSYATRRDYEAALAARRRELEYGQKLVALQPSNKAFRFLEAKARFAVARHLSDLDREEEARAMVIPARSEMAVLRKLDPSNVEWEQIETRIANFLRR
jgi:tetratricopeptide (TPR) repeat protein